MLIVNADDYGRSQVATDRILACCQRGRVTSVSGMVFMQDSERAADLAKACGLSAGLHLNFSQRFDCEACKRQDRIVRFLRSNKFAFLLFHPALVSDFEYVFQRQLEEFVRLYGSQPTHFDGHHHMHVCTNMLVGCFIPRGRKVRRSFSFTVGEKSAMNRLYRSMVDKIVIRRYACTDYLFSLSNSLRWRALGRVMDLAKDANVELQTHPENSDEFDWLMSDACVEALAGVQTGSFRDLQKNS